MLLVKSIHCYCKTTSVATNSVRVFVESLHQFQSLAQAYTRDRGQVVAAGQNTHVTKGVNCEALSTEACVYREKVHINTCGLVRVVSDYIVTYYKATVSFSQLINFYQLSISSVIQLEQHLQTTHTTHTHTHTHTPHDIHELKLSHLPTAKHKEV